MTVREEEVTIGNPGFRQYRYRVTWKGDTVVRMTPVGEPVTTGFSDFDGKPVEVFYGRWSGTALPAGVHAGKRRANADALAPGRRFAGFLALAEMMGTGQGASPYRSVIANQHENRPHGVANHVPIVDVGGDDLRRLSRLVAGDYVGLGLMGTFLVSTLGSIAGVYLAWRITTDYLE